MPRTRSWPMRDATRRRRAARTRLLCPTMVAIIPLVTGCAAGMSRLKTGLNAKPGVIAMPDLFRMSKTKAVSTLKLAGHTGDISWDDQLCGSVVDGQIVEKGEICRQTPAAAQDLPVGGAVTLLVQSEDPRHGKVGQFGEWHLMPDVVGLSIDKARDAMHVAGFTDERTHMDERDEPGCRPGIVCRTYPAALERAGQDSDRYLTVGIAPKSPAADAPPPASGREGAPAPTPDASATTPPPPAKAPDSYF